MISQVTLSDGTVLPAIGEGTWYLGENKSAWEEEKRSLIAGVHAGMKLIDTAEMYGNGRAEILTGAALKEIGRNNVFLVSKVLPGNAAGARLEASCNGSLKRLGTDYLDMYLLHWRGGYPLEETVYGMNRLVHKGKIRRWGVSNFDLEDMEELWQTLGGSGCLVNQDLYHLGSRGVETALLPWMKEHHVALMAYCPLAQKGSLKNGMLQSRAVLEISAARNATPEQILLAFLIRNGITIAIPRTGNMVHAIQNAGAGDIQLTDDEYNLLSEAFPAPSHRVPLDIQ